jgi:hypothetical protein
MSFKTYESVSSSLIGGKEYISYVYKPTVAAPGTAGFWVDASMSAGIPKYNAYVGTQFEATTLTGSGNNGIFPGMYGSSKYLFSMQLRYGNASASSPIPSYLILMDYLMFYPLIDMDSVDLQEFTNPVSLPRYATGDGVQMFLVSTVPSTVATTVTINYTNCHDQSKTTTFNYAPTTNTGVCGVCSDTVVGTTGVTPFIPLQSGCRGVKSVQSVQLSSGAGGLCALVLAYPLASSSIVEAATVSETVFLTVRSKMPKIEAGAYLNFITKQSTNFSGQLLGELVFVTGE